MLTIDVLRPASGSDCTNNGVSSRYKQLVLVNAEGPTHGDDERQVVLQNHVPGCLRIVPKALLGRWVMFGGNYAACSDSRFTEACQRLLGGRRFYGAVAIHDRVED